MLTRFRLEKQLVLQLQLLEDLLLEVICRLTTPPKKVAFWYFHIFFISSCYLQRFFRTGVHHHATFKLHHCKKQDKIRRRGRTGIGKSPNCAMGLSGWRWAMGHGFVATPKKIEQKKNHTKLLSIHVDTTNHLMGMSISHSTLFRYWHTHTPIIHYNMKFLTFLLFLGWNFRPFSPAIHLLVYCNPVLWLKKNMLSTSFNGQHIVFSLLPVFMLM